MYRVSAAVVPPSWSTANLDWSMPSSASPNSLDYSLQVHLWVTKSRPPCASLNSLDYSIQVHLWVHSIITSTCICTLDQWRPPSSHDHGLQVHPQTCLIAASMCISEFNLVSASKCISKIAGLRPLSASLSYTIWASKCVSQLVQSRPPSASLTSTRSQPPVHLWVTRSRPPNPSPNWLNHDLQVHLWVQLDFGLKVHLQTRLIAGSKCISKFSQSGSPGAPAITHQYHLPPDWPYIYI